IICRREFHCCTVQHHFDIFLRVVKRRPDLQFFSQGSLAGKQMRREVKSCDFEAKSQLPVCPQRAAEDDPARNRQILAKMEIQVKERFIHEASCYEPSSLGLTPGRWPFGLGQPRRFFGFFFRETGVADVYKLLMTIVLLRSETMPLD